MHITDRALLVVDARPDAVAALRERVQPHRAVLRRAASAHDVDDELARLRPWPYGVVLVDRPEAPAATTGRLLRTLGERPVPVICWGTAPVGLHCRCVHAWSELRDAVCDLVEATVAGARLADHRGVAHAGALVASPLLEGLLGVAPGALPLGAAAAARLDAVACRHHLPFRVARAGPGRARLVPTG